MAGRAGQTQLSGFVDVLVNQGFEVVALMACSWGVERGKGQSLAVFPGSVASDTGSRAFRGDSGSLHGAMRSQTALAQGVECSKVVLISSPSSVREVLERFAGFIGLSPASTVRFLARVEDSGGNGRVVEHGREYQALFRPGAGIHDEADAEIPSEMR